jgi:uncharacterized membrane protein YdbT with pleckstrin-like domain
MNEHTVWSSGPSQMMALELLLFLCGVGGACYFLLDSVVPPVVSYVFPAIGLINLLVIQSMRYELTNERLITQSGIFSKTIDELELYRVRDFQIKQPFYLRLHGLANIVLLTLDQSTPILVIYAVPNARSLLNTIRALVETRRDAKGVRAVDFGPH